MSKLYLVAHIAGRAVAIDSEQVESAVDLGQVTPVPCAYPQVRGLAALRSRVVTVIDTRIALGLPVHDAPTSRAVITVLDGHHYAVMVDALDDVAPFEPLPLGTNMLDGGWRTVGCGIIERDDEPILVIDLRALIPGLALAA